MAQSTLDLAINPALSASRDGDTGDGRRLRSERSRKCIVEALISLIRNDEIMPSAERVSEKANVGLRTVFRHFEDMDSLYQQVSETLEAEIEPLFRAPFQSDDWCGRLFEMIDRRAEAFEALMPFKIHATARRLQSGFLRDRHRCAVESDLELLCAVVPDSFKRDESTFQAIAAALSFDVWCRLRRDQGCSPEQAKAAMTRLVEGLTTPLATPSATPLDGAVPAKSVA